MTLIKENMAEQEGNYFIVLPTELVKTKWLVFQNQECETFEERFLKTKYGKTYQKALNYSSSENL